LNLNCGQYLAFLTKEKKRERERKEVLLDEDHTATITKATSVSLDQHREWQEPQLSTRGASAAKPGLETSIFCSVPERNTKAMEQGSFCSLKRQAG
jgi:hypothetical protein